LNDLLHVGSVIYSFEAVIFGGEEIVPQTSFLRYGASENHSGIRNNLLEHEVTILGK